MRALPKRVASTLGTSAWRLQHSPLVDTEEIIMFDSVEMDEVGTQGQDGRQNQGQERDTSQPRRDDRQGQDQDSGDQGSKKQDQSGLGKRHGPGQEEEEEN
jgi:hypothetical protein